MKFGALLVIGTDGQERRYEIDVPSLLVGSGAGSGILLDDPSIIDRHARLLVESGTVTLKDLGSEQGTFVGGERIAAFTKHRIGPGRQPQGAIRAGETLTGSLRIENRGRVVDRVRLGISGIPARWLQDWRPELSLSKKPSWAGPGRRSGTACRTAFTPTKPPSAWWRRRCFL